MFPLARRPLCRAADWENPRVRPALHRSASPYGRHACGPLTSRGRNHEVGRALSKQCPNGSSGLVRVQLLAHLFRWRPVSIDGKRLPVPLLACVSVEGGGADSDVGAAGDWDDLGIPAEVRKFELLERNSFFRLQKKSSFHPVSGLCILAYKKGPCSQKESVPEFSI